MTAGVPPDIKVIYRQEFRRCGRQGCTHCRPGAPGHGPYWYANWSEGGQRHKLYLGRDTPPGVMEAGGRREAEPAGQLPYGNGETATLPPQRETAAYEREPNSGPVALPPLDGPDIAVQVHRSGAEVAARQPHNAHAEAGRQPHMRLSPEPIAGMSGALRVQTLGGFAVRRDGRLLAEGSWSLRKAGALFKCLLSQPGQRAGRDTLIEALWPEVESDAGRRNLRAGLHQLRRLLDPPGAARSHIQETGDVLAVVPAPGSEAPPGWLDARDFIEAAARTGNDLQACRAALALYHGEFLPDDRYEEWAQAYRERLRSEYQKLLLRAGKLSAERGEYAEAESYFRALLDDDRCHEEGAARLIGMLAAQGDRAAAVRVYDTLAAALEEDLGLRPSKELQALHARLQAAQRAPVAAEALAPRPTSDRLSNLPAGLTSFVGRERELAAVEALLEGAGPEGPCRLLTLLGTGGAGKTRLALAAGERILAGGVHDDGVWLVELAACAGPDLVPAFVAQALGLKEDAAPTAGDALITQLTDFLAARRMLLILDNCEHLIAACARLAAQLLQVCPGLRVLATSREPLGVAGETHYAVPSLSLPDTHGAPLPPAQLAEYEAIALFTARARARSANFALTTANASTIEAICRRLDGIPLAIELAAARTSVLGVDGVAARLEDRFRLLVGGPRTVLPRQQTLRAALDWSYNLLEARERLLLRRLAVFAGGWTLAAAEQVCGDALAAERDPSPPRAGPVPPLDAADLLDLLEGLAAKSLVTIDLSAGEPRYALLETIRQYAWDHLTAAGEAGQIQHRHAAWCLAFVVEAEQGLRGPDQPAWLRRLEMEHPSIRAALAWLRQRPDESLLCLRLAAPLWRFWAAHGHVHEGRALLDGIIEATEGAAPAPTASEEMRHAWQAARAAVLSGAGNLAEYAADLPRSRALHEEALAMRRLLGDPMAIAGSLGNLANTASMQGDLQAAAALYDEAVPLFRMLENTWAVAACLSNLGPIVMDLGDLDRAGALLEESLALRRAMNDTWGIAVSLKSLGSIALERGDLAAAAALQQEALDLRRALGDRRAIAESLTCCAAVTTAQGEPVAAWTLLQESLGLSYAVGDTVGLTFELLELAQTLVALDQPAGAIHVLAAAETLRASIGMANTTAGERQREGVTRWCAERLSGSALAAARASGAGRHLDSLVTWVIDSPAPRAGAALALGS